MKSNYTMDSRYRFEGRINLPRRRVATKTCSENGDFEMELSLAIRESLKYAKENEMKLKQMESSSPVNGAQRDDSFSCMADKMLNFASGCEKNEGQGQGGNEAQQLKDLLLMHIELIQQQQELLTKKDKEILVLRNEKDSLLWRLQKKEKRMAQMKQKEDLLEKQIADAKDFVTAPEGVAPSGYSEKSKVEKLEQPLGRKRKQQQKKRALPSKLKRYGAHSDRTSEPATLGRHEESDVEEENSETADDDDNTENEDSDDKMSVDIVSHQAPPHRTRRDEEEEEESEEEEEDEGDPHPEPVLRTECLYHMACCVEPLPEDTASDVMLEDTSEKDVLIGDPVETPGWRINVFTNRYQLEGTENITDEAYQRRHQKHELEEKRRKRWDIRRLREQRVFEKLRGKEQIAMSSTDNTQAFSSFLPSLEDVTHLEISKSVPIMAFGQAVPYTHPLEFELPWDTSPSARKSQSGRGRQK